MSITEVEHYVTSNVAPEHRVKVDIVLKWYSGRSESHPYENYLIKSLKISDIQRT